MTIGRLRSEFIRRLKRTIVVQQIENNIIIADRFPWRLIMLPGLTPERRCDIYR